ncbi:MAG: sulfatase [Verrucomicrobia bacterium]|nr:sulfatase [Verrucomicrobiota bacterium]MDA1068095.1 sulfatase [Verrucomicrobiota bacterium]
MKRRDFLKTAVAGVTATAASNLYAADRSDCPNVVFLLADQMRAHSMHCMGDPQVITPNLDKLASQGLMTTNMIAASPVCTPYRGQLMTGRYGHATGVVHNDIKLPNSETTIADQIKKHGYHTGYIGKWHLAGHRKNPVAKEDRRNWDFWAVRNCSHAHFEPQYWVNNETEAVTVNGWEPEVQTDVAIEYIRQQKNNPFFLMVSYGPPHNPYKAPERFVKQYEGRKLEDRPNVPPPDKKDQDQLLHYNAMITSLDECVGRISAELQRSGLAENTIFVFTSDHGDMLGSQGHKLKQRPWEESINVPFIIRQPGKIKPGQKRDWIVSSVDLMPTLLGLCGAEIPDAVQGIDHTNQFHGRADEIRDSAFLFNTHNGGGPGCDWRGIRTKDWVYAYHMEGDWILYDLKKDPYQLNNLVDQSKY